MDRSPLSMLLGLLIATSMAADCANPTSGLGPSPSPSDTAALHGLVRQAAEGLPFTPLVPEYVPPSLRPSVSVGRGGRDPVGSQGAVLLHIDFLASGKAVVRIVEGPAGCCLDYARPNATMDVTIREGVAGRLESVEPQYGGPILWWVEHPSVYVAVSGPSLTSNELLQIARSMMPLR